jgi:hypothetical protein
VTFSWSTYVFLAIFCATVHWLVARAKITMWFWDAMWLPDSINRLLTCAACSGFWIGLGFGALGVRPLVTGHWWLDVIAAGTAAMYATPVAEAVMLWGLDRSKIH